MFGCFLSLDEAGRHVAGHEDNARGFVPQISRLRSSTEGRLFAATQYCVCILDNKFQTVQASSSILPVRR